MSNHGAVLSILYQESDVTARIVGERLGITERTVRRILKDLEAGGYITRQRRGRTNTYRVHLELSLRRPDQHGVTVGELLRIMHAHGDAKPSKGAVGE
ncbi:MAG: winged helix-turn-helix transcriptional regulator [Anaerolineales bacterium]